ncbi:winged helix DNA-binding domain-containing protein [Nonomuraea sp. NPDC005501]|uniref:winged helix DNA-binding domain-containing protein n=1 Tax=Nonomuraea sp. NPDC005501 TaxID=3156884 RepID=UPI0033B06C77
MDVLSRRALNRATLERQLLLARTGAPALEVVERLAGLQAQDPDPPYVGLWSRVTGFRHDDLTTLLYERRVVRATLYRGTQHLVSAADYRWLRPLLEPMLERWRRGAFGRATPGVDPAELAATARGLLSGGVLTRPELGRALAERWPGADPVALARSVQGLLPVVHPPPDGTWGRRGPTPFTLADDWLGAPPATTAHATRDGAADGAAGGAVDRARELLLRYLAAFGPATVKDAQAWSGLTRLRAVADELRPRLAVFRDEEGAELLDLPEAPRPDPDTPAPVRFLAALDNVVLGHADRRRLMTDEGRRHIGVYPALLVDGFVRGLWEIRRAKGTATLEVRLFTPVTGAEEAAVAEEGERLLRFAAADAPTQYLRLRPMD